MSNERVDPRQYNLSDKQLAYLLDEDIGTRNEENLENDIEETVSRLNLRLQYLIEDISLFYTDDWLDRDSASDVWRNLTDIQRNDPLYNQPVAYRGIMPDEAEYLELAIHIGHLSRLLYAGGAPEFNEDKIALGLLIGLTGGWLKEDWVTDSAMQKFVQDLPDKDLMTETFKMPSTAARQKLQDVLSDVEAAIEKEPITFESDEELRKQLKDSELTLTPALFPYAQGKLEELDRPSVPHVVDEVVDEIESNQNLRCAELLAERLHEDIEILIETTWRGGQAIDIFWSIYSTDDLQTSEDVVGVVETDRQQASKLLTDLKGREPPWDDRPLITEEFELTTTDYGTLIGQMLATEEETAEYTVPPQDEIISICHGHILGSNGSEQQDFVESLINEGNLG